MDPTVPSIPQPTQVAPVVPEPTSPVAPVIPATPVTPNIPPITAPSRKWTRPTVLLLIVGIVVVSIAGWYLYQRYSPSNTTPFRFSPSLGCAATDTYTGLDNLPVDLTTVCFLDASVNVKARGSVDPRILKMTKIVELHLGNNGLFVLPSGLFDLSSLIYLGLSNNNLTSIPSDIKKLVNLQILSLAGNKISSLPEEIGTLSKLKNLIVTGNGMSSDEIAHLKKLLPQVVITD